MKTTFKERCERDKFRSYKSDLKKIQELEKAIEKLRKKQERLPIVKDKVRASEDDFPFLEMHVSVEAYGPVLYSSLERMIYKKRLLIKAYSLELEEIDNYIDNIADDLTRDIFRRVFLEGKTQAQTARELHYTPAYVSQLIKKEFRQKLKE